MRMTEVPFRSTSFVSCLGCIVALGCGGATPKPAAPESHSQATASRPAASESKEAAAQQPPADSTSETPADPVITRTLSDRVFAPRVAYMVNYPVSGAKDAAERKCSVKFPEPGQWKSACLEKERGRFTADVLVFEKSDEGQWIIIYKRNGNALSQMSKSRVSLGQDTPEKLSVKVEADNGWRPLFAGRKAFDVKFRDEYSIELEEPQYGSLVYDARIGLID